MAGRNIRPQSEPLVFTRVDPDVLAQFVPRTKRCTMNCGPHTADEPVFIFRARDKHAMKAISNYTYDLPNGEHRDAVIARWEDFKRFAEEHPECMKYPDTASSNQSQGGDK